MVTVAFVMVVTFLCLRRGVSITLTLLYSIPALFSAYAEVFPEGQFVALIDFAFLCLRRGVSPCFSSPYQMLYFSLPTQRCFRYATRSLPFFHLFSAYAEVFLMRRKAQRLNGSFLCLRRGVSDTRERRGLHLIFSLPTQRCFHTSYSQPLHQFLFSAYAEVFSLAK